jgi:hypothetical protein
MSEDPQERNWTCGRLMNSTIEDVYKTAPLFQKSILPLRLCIADRYTDRLSTLMLWCERRDHKHQQVTLK